MLVSVTDARALGYTRCLKKEWGGGGEEGGARSGEEREEYDYCVRSAIVYFPGI